MLYKLTATAAALSLILLTSCSDSATEPDDHSEEAVGIVLQVDGLEVARSENGVVTGRLDVPVSEDITVNVQLLMEDGDLVSPEDDHVVQVTVANSSIVGARDGDDSGKFELDGVSAGSTTIVIDILHGGHSDFTSPSIPVTVS